MHRTPPAPVMPTLGGEEFMKLITIQIAFLIVSICGILGCGQRHQEMPEYAMVHFLSLKEIELCDINPLLDMVTKEGNNDNIGGYHVIKSRVISNDKSLLNILFTADRANNDEVAVCFNPKHAIRDPNNNLIYTLICWECLQASWSYTDGNGFEGGNILIDGDYEQEFISEWN